jgi:hypothetical protein
MTVALSRCASTACAKRISYLKKISRFARRPANAGENATIIDRRYN